MKNNTIANKALKERLYEKYKLKKRELKVVIEELKQRVTAKKEKVKRYDNRNEQFQQNRLFQNNQRRLFEKLEGMERGCDEVPDKEATNLFWREIWEKDVSHKDTAEWIRKVE